jgi:hypothetical protein
MWLHCVIARDTPSTRPCAQSSPRVFAGSQSPEYVLEVVTRSPLQFRSRAFVHIDPIDGREHPPISPRVLVFVTGCAARDDARCIGAQLCRNLSRERGRRADDVSGETDRRRVLECEQMRVDRVFDVDAPIQVLVHLGVHRVVRRTRFGVVVVLGKNRDVRRITQGSAWSRWSNTQVFRGRLRDAVFLGIGAVSSVIHAAGSPPPATVHRQMRWSCW